MREDVQDQIFFQKCKNKISKLIFSALIKRIYVYIVINFRR